MLMEGYCSCKETRDSFSKFLVKHPSSMSPIRCFLSLSSGNTHLVKVIPDLTQESTALLSHSCRIPELELLHVITACVHVGFLLPLKNSGS